MWDFLFPDLRSRNVSGKERLELPAAEPDRVQRTIRQFRLINRLLGASNRLIREHFFTIMERDPGRTYTLLDLGAGGCDIAIRAVEDARRRGLKLAVTALDNDPRVLAVAHRAVRDFPEIRIVEGDALDSGRLGSFDFVFSNHFLHHLAWNDIRRFLENVAVQTRIAFMMNDLKRSNPAFLGFTIFSGLLLHRSFHFHDGRLSIRRGFLPEELRDFLRRSCPGMDIQVLETHPARVVLLHLSGGGHGSA